MSNAAYVRFGNEELDFINKISREEKVTISETIKKLIDYASKKIKIEKCQL